MTGGPPGPDTDSFRQRVPWPSLAVLAAALLATWAIAATVVFRWHGTTGLLAASIAAGVCWASASTALWITAWVGGRQAVSGVLFAVLLRTGVPLVTGLMISVSHRPLAQAGVFGLILIHYLVALAVETPLAVRLVRRRSAIGSVSA